MHLTEPWEGRSSGGVVSCGRKGLKYTLQEGCQVDAVEIEGILRRKPKNLELTKVLER